MCVSGVCVCVRARACVHLIEEEDRTKREGSFVTQTLNQQLSVTKHGVQDDCSQIDLADFGVPRILMRRKYLQRSDVSG